VPTSQEREDQLTDPISNNLKFDQAESRIAVGGHAGFVAMVLADHAGALSRPA